jgi:CRP/FNR family transcriptional regulator
MASKIWCLGEINIFNEINPDEAAEAGLVISEKNATRKEIVLEPEETDKVYIIKRGHVKLYQLTPDGKRIIIDTLGPGGVFGNFGGEEAQNFAEASTDTIICIAKKDTFFKMIAEKPQVSYRLMRLLFNRLTQAQDYAAAVASGNVLSKLKFKLSELADKYGETQGEKVKLKERFTHEELADMIGVSRETVTKLLGSLRRRGVIEIDGRNVAFHKEKLELA